MEFLKKLDEVNDYLNDELTKNIECELFIDVLFNGNCYGWMTVTLRTLDYDEVSYTWDFHESFLKEECWKKGHFPNIKTLDEMLIYRLNYIKDHLTKKFNKGGIYKIYNEIVKHNKDMDLI